MKSTDAGGSEAGRENGDAVVAKLAAFQRTGAGFDGVWAEIGPIVNEFARRCLRKHGVKSPFGDDCWAVDDVVGQTAERLLALVAPTATGRFDAARASKPGISGLRGWLWRIVQRQAVNWARNYRGGRRARGARKTRILIESSLPLNELHAGGASALKRQVMKPVRPELLPILEACIWRLPDPVLRRVMRLHLGEGLSERQTAGRLGLPVTRVHRQRRKALQLLRGLIEEMGFDFESLAA